MAGSGEIKIPITADARDVIRATDDVEEALEDVADALDDMSRDTKRGADKAERAVDDLADTFRDAVRKAKDLGDAGKDAGDDVKRGMERAEDGVEEFKDEANSTAREAAASFDGSAESIGDALQEVAANAFAGFGPAGAVAGLAAAAGIGLAMAGFQDVQKAQEELQELTQEWGNTYMEEGSKVLSTATIIAKGLEILSNKHVEVTENAKLWGVSEETALAAMAGSPAALDEVSKSLDRKREAAEKDAQAAQELAQANGGTLGSLTPMEVEVNKATDAFNKHRQAQQDGAAVVDTMSYFLRDQAEAAKDATKATDEFGDTVVTLPDGKQIYIDAETGKATDNVSAIERKIYGIPDGSASVSVDTSGAQRTVDSFIRSNDGKSFKIYGKTVTSGFGEGRG